jgi:acetolactate synthase I/II/III large subunit
MSDASTGVREASDAIVELLNRNGVSELFVMPGDAFPVLEAIARRHTAGEQAPRIVTCLHEIVALAAAHGHYMVSGRPQACLFHVDVGLQMAGGMLHNAQRGRAGVVIFSGRTPMTFDGSMRGGRVVDVHWMQDRPDQASVVRDYVKWHADAYRTENLGQLVQRAFQVAASEPAGPVYVSLLREMLLEQAPIELPDPERHAAPPAPVPSDGDLHRLAELVAQAERPLAIAGHVGRSAAGFHALGEFAEELAIPVVTRGARGNMSSDSAMHMGADPGPLLGEADLVLLLDVDVPYIPLFHSLAPGAKVAQIDIDALKPDITVWGFPVDLALQGSTAVALPRLTELVREVGGDAHAAAADRRRAGLAAVREQRLAELAAAAEAGSPISPAHLAQSVAALVDDDTIVVDDSTTALAVTAAHIPTRVPGSYYQPVGSSMGWGSGAALGAKLAAPDKLVINLNAEGNFFSGVPEAALWAAAQHRAPFLTVVFNNAQYAAIKLGLLHEYPDAALAQSGELELKGVPSLTAIAEACGASGIRVEQAEDLPDALRQAVESVRGGRCALVDVAVAGP